MAVECWVFLNESSRYPGFDFVVSWMSMYVSDFLDLPVKRKSRGCLVMRSLAVLVMKPNSVAGSLALIPLSPGQYWCSVRLTSQSSVRSFVLSSLDKHLTTIVLSLAALCHFAAMYKLLPLISLSLTGAAIIQHQQPLIQHTGAHAEAPLIEGPEELVSSTSLEARITKEALLKRAKHLYKIAEEGIPEYNHPTRVIGSKGTIQLLA